jgi:hypothetical protein
MEEKKKHDSVLMGWVDEPVFKEGSIDRWTVRLHETNIKDIQENYLNEKGYVRMELFVSKAGKCYMRVKDPNSEAAKEYAKKREAEAVKSQDDDIPFL